MSQSDASRRLPPAQALHAFDAAVRHMSFTAAARELGITQAAVSQRIRVLEHCLGRALFVRHPRGLALTEAGRALLPAVQDAFERLSTGITEAFGAPRDAPLTVRTTPSFAAHWLAPRLRAFETLHPAVALRLTSAIWPSEFDLAGVDLEVRYGRGGWEGVECERLTRERLAPVCAPAVARGLGSPADLAGEVLLHTVGFEAGWEQWLTRAGARQALERATVLRCDTMVVSLELAVHGAGVALGRSGFVDSLLSQGRLAVPFDCWLDTKESFFLARSAGRPPRPEAELFWNWMIGQREAASVPDSTIQPRTISR